MRVILDTNVILSALFSPTGAPFAILDAWRGKRFVLVSDYDQIGELRRASRYDQMRTKLEPALVGRTINLIRARAEMPARRHSVQRSADPDDDFLLEIAEAGGADRLVSGDRRGLLALGRHGATQIVTPRAFAEELGL